MVFVVYFDQRLAAAHLKRWSKYAFLNIFNGKKLKKGGKSKKFLAKLSKKMFFLFKFAPKRWSSVL